MILNVALDRIVSIEQSNETFIPNTDIDFSEYFDDVIGVTKPDAPIEKIVLRFSKQRLPYIVTKPLNPWQKINQETGTVTLNVIPNSELIAQLLWFGEDVEVLAPERLRNILKEKIKKMQELYIL